MGVSILQQVACGTCACLLWLSRPPGKVEGCGGIPRMLNQHLFELGICPLGTIISWELRGWRPRVFQQPGTPAVARASLGAILSMRSCGDAGDGTEPGESPWQSPTSSASSAGLFLDAAPLCLELSVPMCFLLPWAGAGASPLTPVPSCPNRRALSPADIPLPDTEWGESGAGEGLAQRCRM